MTAPLLSYATLYDFLRVIFGAILTIIVLMQLYAWRPRRRPSAWRDLPAHRAGRIRSSRR